MEINGPFPELDNHEYRIIKLANGITALLISSEKKDTAVRRATSKLDIEDRRVIAKLLRETNGASSTPKETPRQRRSTLISDQAGSLRNLFRTSQRGLGALEEDSSSPSPTTAKSGNSQRPLEETQSNNTPNLIKSRSGQIGEESKSRSFRVSQRYAGVPEDTSVGPNEHRRVSRRVDGVSPDDNENDDRLSIRSHVSHKSLPGNTSFRRNRSHRLSSAVAANFLQMGSAPGAMEDSLPTITDMAAAAVCVSVGSLSDPEDCQGLAHVVEHMVFMGSERFPSENDWDIFIASAGGDSNATTESERTTFHFSVPQESFEPCLTRFSQFFHNPLLRKESLQRELAAIESEFNDSAGEVSFRLAEVACATARRGPFSQFACGNSKTLKSNPDLHSHVADFFKSHFIAPNMTVVLYSSDSLSDLEDLCRRQFESIPAVREPRPGARKLVKFTPQLPPFCSFDENHGYQGKAASVPGEDGYTLGCIVVCDPEGNPPHTLQLSWQLPCQRKNWSSKPLLYIAQLISSETEGGILHELKSHGWANALFSSDGTYSSGIEGNSVSTLFSMYILLTESGLINWEKVVMCVFEYLGMLAREGVQQWIFEEIKRCLETQYVFRDSAEPGSMVETLCRRLCAEVSELPPEQVCNGEDLVFTFDPEAIRAILRLLVPETCRIDLITKACELSRSSSRNSNTNNGKQAGERNGAEMSALSSLRTFRSKPLKKRVFDSLLTNAVVKIEPWYQTHYCVVPTSRKTLSKWRGAMRNSKTFARPPRRNEYISPVLNLKDQTDSKRQEQQGTSNAPAKLKEKKPSFVSAQGKIGKIEAKIDPNMVLVCFEKKHGRTVFSERVWLNQSDVSTVQKDDETATTNGNSTNHQDGSARRILSSSAIGSSIFSAEDLDAFSRERGFPALVELEPGSTKTRLKLWHLQHGGFVSSRVSVTLLFNFAPRVLSSLNSALLDLLLVCLEESLAEERYPSAVAGSRLDIRAEATGVMMTFAGLSSAVTLLIDRCLPVFLGCATHGIRHLKNLDLDAQLQVVSARLGNDDCSLRDTLNGVLRLDEHHPLTKLKALEGTTNIKAKLDQFSRGVVSGCCAVGLCFGNITINEAAELKTKISSMMHVHQSKGRMENGLIDWNAYFARPRILNIPPCPKPSTKRESNLMGSTSVFVAQVPSSSVLVYFQLYFEPEKKNSDAANETEAENRKMTKIMCQLLAQLIKEPLFNTLRTKWQIAYHAHASCHQCDSSVGLTIEVSSHHTGTVELVEIIDEFLGIFQESILKPMATVDFNRHLRALELRKLEKDRGPSEEARRHFDTLVQGLESGIFDWNAESREIYLVSSLTKSSVMDLYQQCIHPQANGRRTLTLLIVGEAEMIQSTKTSLANRAGGANRTSVRQPHGLESTHSGDDVVREEDENDLKDEIVDELVESKVESARNGGGDMSTVVARQKFWWQGMGWMRKLSSS